MAVTISRACATAYFRQPGFFAATLPTGPASVRFGRPLYCHPPLTCMHAAKRPPPTGLPKARDARHVPGLPRASATATHRRRAPSQPPPAHGSGLCRVPRTWQRDAEFVLSPRQAGNRRLPHQRGKRIRCGRPAIDEGTVGRLAGRAAFRRIDAKQTHDAATQHERPAVHGRDLPRLGRHTFGIGIRLRRGGAAGLPGQTGHHDACRS